MQFLSDSRETTQRIGEILGQLAHPGMVMTLSGRLGSGKTTFTQGFARGLGIRCAVKSPTYTIVREYDVTQRNLTFYHLDAYRLEDGGADTVDMDEFIQPDAITLIEWSEFITESLPEAYLTLNIDPLSNDDRILRWGVVGPDSRYKTLIAQLSQHPELIPYQLNATDDLGEME